MVNTTNQTLLASAQLLAKFSQSINWNALLYFFDKILFTLLSFLLYTYLTTNDFATWANINSIIFLLLLWIDCGFRKSIPRYLPEFSRNKLNYQRFIYAIIIWQTLILIFFLPLFFYCAHSLADKLKLLPLNNFFLQWSSALFFVEGLVAIIRLIYHSHFWNKQFNTLSGAILALEMLANMLFIIYIPHTHLLQSIFITKIISSAILVIIATFMLPKLCSEIIHTYSASPPINVLRNDFIKHSTIMWFNTTIKSLSERNFMVPLLTYILGAPYANLFKVANDGALLFYRSIIKTIGTTDTALLAHAETSSQESILLPIAFKQLIKKVATICIIVSTLFSFVLISNKSVTHSPLLHTFCIITIGYLLEAMLSPYERILEVKRQYLNLFIAYIPYIVGMTLLLYFNLLPTTGLLGCIIIIQGVRLSGSLLMTSFARKKYKLPLPLTNISKILLMVIPAYIIFYIIISCTSASHYLYTAADYFLRLKR